MIEPVHCGSNSILNVRFFGTPCIFLSNGFSTPATLLLLHVRGGGRPPSSISTFLSLSSRCLAEGFQGLTALQFYILSSIFFVVSLLCVVEGFLVSSPCRRFSRSQLTALQFFISCLSLGLTALQQRPAACLPNPLVTLLLLLISWLASSSPSSSLSGWEHHHYHHHHHN